MKIYRDNIEIELTADEIEQAYRQYLYENDKEVLKIKLNEDDEQLGFQRYKPLGFLLF